MIQNRQRDQRKARQSTNSTMPSRKAANRRVVQTCWRKSDGKCRRRHRMETSSSLVSCRRRCSGWTISNEAWKRRPSRETSSGPVDSRRSSRPSRRSHCQRRLMPAKSPAGLRKSLGTLTSTTAAATTRAWTGTTTTEWARTTALPSAPFPMVLRLTVPAFIPLPATRAIPSTESRLGASTRGARGRRSPPLPQLPQRNQKRPRAPKRRRQGS
mmetsp:Transcript_18604/g.39941  ORF Transcript_18604/g.39941 Transcript_18604/m.39941 type:complete len:213 (-) Transcript_18604:901-1539(-)